MISNRAQILFRETPPLVEAHFKCASDPFDIEKNKNGYINFGTAENFLIEDILLEKIESTPKLTKSDLHYNFPWGAEDLRESYCHFLKDCLNIDIFNKDDIAVGCGLSAIIEILSFSILNDGDKVLTIAPLYNGFYHDIETRFKGKIELSHCLSNFGELDFSKLESDIKEIKPRVILINNPHNPAGYTYRESEIRKIIELSKKYELKIIADEIYANSVFGKTNFTSFLDKRFIDLDYQESIYHLYGLAKDFALSGFKVGLFASLDKKVTKATQALSYFHTVSTQTQKTVNHLISDTKWCQHLFEQNSLRLKEVFQTLSKGLEELSIQHFPSDSGIFTMIDLSKYLKEDSREAEMELFNFLIDELKVSITPGQFFGHKNNGFFRVCYAKPKEIVEAFLTRLEKLNK